MFKRWLCVLLTGALMLSSTVRAAEDIPNEAVVLSAQEAVAEIAPVEYAVGFTVNGAPVPVSMTVCVINQMTYVSVYGLAKALLPEAEVYWADGAAQIYLPDKLMVTVQPGLDYIIANDRYLYVPGGPVIEAGEVLVPVRTLAKALGAGVIWSVENGTNVVSGSGAIMPGDEFYNAEDLYWLSRIIYSESGNQPLEGKIAVGNVILNRVADPRFPGSIREVIFDRRGGVYQFTPAGSSSINRTPNESSVVAAKLVLDGAIVLPGCLYFNATRSSSWAARNRTYVTTIGGHNFYQ